MTEVRHGRSLLGSPKRRPRARGGTALSHLRPRSFRSQIVLVTAGATALTMVALTLLLQLVLARTARDDMDRVLSDRSRSVANSIHITRDGAITAPRADLGPGVAIFGSNGALAAGYVPESLEHDYGRLRSSSGARTVSGDDATRIRAQPFARGGQSGVVIVSERSGPYEEAERLALLVSIATGIVMVGATAGLAAWTTRRALRPVGEMAQTAADWSQHDLSRRFELDSPTHELSALAATMDSLLDRVADAIRSEQRLTAELAHELRTPLTAIHGEAELVLLRGGLSDEQQAAIEEIVAASRRMSTTIATLLDLARSEQNIRSSTQVALTEVFDEVRRDAPDSQAKLAIEETALRASVPKSIAVRAVSPVVANALKFARTSVRVSFRERDRRFVDIRVTDDGPGLTEGTADSIFVPGASTSGGSGLGLAIARRVAQSAGGQVTMEATGPTCFTISLPIA